MHLGPMPLRAYALMIIIGIVVAVLVTGRRLRARGMDPVLASEIAYWAVPFGIVGARIYHVISTPDAYFGSGGHPIDAFKIWNGGLGIWGGIAAGALGAWLAARRNGVSLALFADAAAPGIILAQAIGRWGNWFNQELYGKPTNLPWALHIDPEHQVIPGVSHYQPTFLYEFLWNLVVAGILLVVDRRRRLGRGKLFFLYVALYTFGRFWIEMLRIDTADKVLGARVNVWVAILVCLGAVVALLLLRRPIDPDVSQEDWDAAVAAGTTPAAQAARSAGAAGGPEAGGSGAGGPLAPGLDAAGSGIAGLDGPDRSPGADEGGAEPVAVGAGSPDRPIAAGQAPDAGIGPDTGAGPAIPGEEPHPA